MPLDRKHVTIASNVMLPTYAVYNTGYAVVFLNDWQNRLGLAPSLDFARSWMPVQRWGLMWLAVAVIMIVALTVRNRWVFIVALALNIGVWGSWGAVVQASVTSQPNVSFLAGSLPLFVAIASFASMLSLLTRER